MRKFINSWTLFRKIIKYNMKIIFANQFIWFLLAAFAFYVFISIHDIFENASLDESFIYGIMLFPGILLIFYPTVFGIQKDADANVLELLFGIPDYRFKVWLVRLIMIYAITFLIVIGFTAIGSIAIYPVRILEMAGQLMFPLLFIGSLGFMFSTIIKNGNGTAVVMVIIGVFLLILTDMVERTMWNIFLNPFNLPRDMNELIWHNIALKNRIFLVTGSILFLLFGLFNLQKREKFI